MSKPKAVVPGYTLCGKIGSGTSGDVYRAKKNTAVSGKVYPNLKCKLNEMFSSCADFINNQRICGNQMHFEREVILFCSG